GEIDHMPQVGLGKRDVAQRALSLNEHGVFLRIQMRSPFDGLLGADESRNEETLDAPMPLFHMDTITLRPTSRPFCSQWFQWSYPRAQSAPPSSHRARVGVL